MDAKLGPAKPTYKSLEVVLMQDAVGPFLRKYRTNQAGTVVNVADTQLDGTTSYIPTGTVSPFISEELFSERWDHIAATYPSTTEEVYTYRRGGAAGTIVGTVTVTYTDATKCDLSTVVKT